MCRDVEVLLVRDGELLLLSWAGDHRVGLASERVSSLSVGPGPYRELSFSLPTNDRGIRRYFAMGCCSFPVSVHTDPGDGRAALSRLG